MMPRAAQSNRLDTLPIKRSALLWIILTQILVLAPHITHLPTWAFGLSLGLMLLAGWLTWNNKPLPPKSLLGVAAITGGVGCFVYFGTLNGRDPGVTLLSLMLALKLLEMRSLRDAMLVVFLGYFLIITQFLYSQHMLLILYLILAALAVTVGLISLTDVSESLDLRRKIRLAASLLLQSLPFMLLLFVLFPRIHGPLWGIPTQEGQARTGLSESMEPGQFSNLIRSDEPAFRAVFDNDPPVENLRYWRGPVLWQFDGRRWTGRTQSLRGEPISRIEGQGIIAPYRLILEPSDKPWVLALDITARAPAELRMTADYQLIAEEPIKEVTEFELGAYTQYQIGTQLSQEERRLGLQLPQSIAPRAQELASTWREESSNNADIVNKALGYFRQQPFVYTLSPPLMRQDPVDQFLFDSRRGFCEHYAGSFVFLMRAAGIPARVVTGYLGGEYNPIGRYLLIRQSDAHAWAEVWLKGSGWVRIDPTAAVAPERIELGIGSALSASDQLPLLLRGRYGNSLINRARLMWDSVDYYWNYWVLAFGPERQRELMRQLGLGSLDWQGLIITLLISSALIIILYTLVFVLRGRHRISDPVKRAYLLFLTKLARVGIQINNSEGPSDLLKRLESERPDLLPQARIIINQYIQLHYADLTNNTNNITQLQVFINNFKPGKNKKMPR
jgi:transglutaminase-like putative cysteine protease